MQPLPELASLHWQFTQHTCVPSRSPPGITCCTAPKVLANLNSCWDNQALCSSWQSWLSDLLRAIAVWAPQTFCVLCCCSWRDRWQQMDVFHRWLVAAQHRHAMRFMTAAAYEHRYLTLGRATIAAWKDGVQHNHRVSMPAVRCATMGCGVMAV